MGLNKQKRTREWCSKEQVEVLSILGTGMPGKRRKDITVPTLVKCSLCKKRYTPRVRECSDRGCWHVYVPPHKSLQ